MNRPIDSQIYDLYNQFIERLFIHGRSFFDDADSSVIFTEETINVCIERYINNYDEGSESFDEKLKKQFLDADHDERELFSHAIWLWGFSVNESKNCNLVFCETSKRCDYGFAHSGQYHLTDKYQEIGFIIRLFKSVFEFKEKREIVTLEEIKSLIVKLCLSYKYRKSFPSFDEYKHYDVVSYDSGKRPMAEILLYLSAPECFERIVSCSHKERITAFFDVLLEENDLLLDDKLYKIRERICELINTDFDFYDEKIRSLWDISSYEDGTDEYSALEFKKNIVLYGPPGTGKTYTAKKIAKAFVLRKLLSSDKIKLSDYLSGKTDETISNYIRVRQLHLDYSYDSFIVGQTISKGDISVVKGSFFELCEEAALEPEYPFVLILDELNRVDLARLFGEAFSGIENRGESIELPYKDEKTNKPLILTVPENLYIIGTMNEIDFSLERLDFALRRRFLWFKHGFNPDSLREMIVDLPPNYQEIFVECATAVNRIICNTSELGTKYEIGHAFFSEISKLYQSMRKTGGSQQNKTVFKNAKKVLWNISIRPMLESYLDNIGDRKKRNNRRIRNELWLKG